jgi:sigma-B regulation protein RsbU (phosphoserine phosphatase)
MLTTVPLLDLRALEKLREEELEEARAIQSVMLPSESLRVRAITISHEFQPMAAVGGDFLDYFELPDKSIGLYLGYVSGKGLPAAMYAALAVGTLRGVHKTGTAPSEVLAVLNRRLLLRGTPRRHAAIQYAVFYPDREEMHIASAGMAGPLHLSAAGCRVLQLSGIPPGLFPFASYDCLTVKLNRGDSVLFFTDGLTDATDQHGEQFGIERLQELCYSKRLAGTEELLGKIFKRVASFACGCEQQDDMAAGIFHFDA